MDGSMFSGAHIPHTPLPILGPWKKAPSSKPRQGPRVVLLTSRMLVQCQPKMDRWLGALPSWLGTEYRQVKPTLLLGAPGEPDGARGYRLDQIRDAR